MSSTTYGVNDAYAVKLWAKKLGVEALKETYIGRFIGEDANSLIHLKNEIQKSSGDRLTFGLRMIPTGDGVTENQVLEGNEESLTTYSDALLINELHHAIRVRSENTIDQERVPYNLRDEAKNALKDWFSDRYDQIFFNHICGFTPETRITYTGNNAILAPSAGRIIRAGSGLTDDNSLNAVSQNFSLDLIDRAVERAKLATPLIRPIKMDGKDKWVMFLHPTQVTALRTNTNAGQWLDITKAALMGGNSNGANIYTGALGEYNGVVLHESVRVRAGVSNAGVAVANTRRAVLCGAQSAAIGFGGMVKNEQRFKWVESLFDYERELGVSGQAIMGLKKTQYPINGTATDFGTIVVSTFAQAS